MGGATRRIIRFHYFAPGTSRARTLASFTLSPPRLTADVVRRAKRGASCDAKVIM